MKNLKLNSGYFVSDWRGKITPITYVKVTQSEYGVDKEVYLCFNEKNTLFEVLPDYKKDQIVPSKVEADILSSKLKKERKDYYKKQIEEYQEILKNL